MVNNIFHHKGIISQLDRVQQAGHKSAILWFTGLSGAGKSTLAHAVEKTLFDQGCRTFVFDGDNVRHGLCSDLTFTVKDRQENIRRIGEMSKLFVEAGIIALAAFISPYAIDRERVRSLVKKEEFIEIYCKASIDVCEHRDTKGLYAKARLGKIPDFTGITSPYEPPISPELELDTGLLSLNICVEIIINYLIDNGIINVNLEEC